MPVWLEDTEDVVLAQGVNVRREYVVFNLLACQNIYGEYLDGIFSLHH